MASSSGSDSGRPLRIRGPIDEWRNLPEGEALEREIARRNVDLQALLERARALVGPATRLVALDESMTPAERREAALAVARHSRLLQKHLSDLLELSRLEAGELKVKPRDTDLAALVRSIASHFDGLAAERGVSFVLDVEDCRAAVDPEKLQRVVMDLLSNAFKFTPAGGRVRCHLEAKADGVVLSVEDSGIGVAPERRAAIFERFRDDGGANRPGIGLALARDLVGLHGGSIDVLESDLGGARFRVTLPVRPAADGGEDPAYAERRFDHATLEAFLEELRLPASASAPGARTAPAQGTRARILVVEDDDDMNRFVSQCLSRDYEVLSARDGQQGLDEALTSLPALVVSDIVMPRAGGTEMFAALRRHPETSGIPVLFVSGQADDDLKVRLLEGGATDFVTKPFTGSELLVRVRNLIAARQSREALQAAEEARRRAVEAAHQQLKSRSERLAELFQRAPGFMAVLRGRDHVFELANETCLRLLGDRDIIGRPLAQALPEIRDQGFVDLLDGVLATGEPHRGSDVPVLLQRAAGVPPEQRYVSFVFQPLAASGGFGGVFVEGYDVTERKRAEDALRAADRRKDEFLATLAHELRNPLAPIRYASRISRTPGATEAEVARASEVIERQVEHMARLLDDLLDVSRITRGKLELRLERLALADHLLAAAETVRPLIEARGHRLTVDVAGAPVAVDADPVRFAQIFANLLTNAAKYTDPGGAIHLRARVEGDKAVVSVLDNGIGIAPELLPRMFEMFSQATGALERSEGGLGIGLALARGLVVLHQGTIEARSAGLGKGSEFVVTLPLTGPALRDMPAAVAPAKRDPTGLRVLVADDNPDSAESTAILLRLLGHDVRAVGSGPEALAVAADFRPHVGVLDIGMPGMNGYEVARRLKAAAASRVVLVAVTGWSQEEDRREATAAGFDHHLAKPVHPDRLGALLASLVPTGPT
jgi:signal transduction histidine kinase